MENYIQKQNVNGGSVLTCSHQSVSKIWEQGTTSVEKGSEIIYELKLLLNDGTDIAFPSYDINSSYEMAEDYLKTL